MTIELSAQQAKLTLHALLQEIERISLLNAPKERKDATISELSTIRATIAMEMMRNGFLDLQQWAQHKF
ncbi:MAG: hypothetical protein NC311_07685 [Muribaculaceae bacterium]|nr:hypothetical protein [Muribaculaceae bacterium]